MHTKVIGLGLYRHARIITWRSHRLHCEVEIVQSNSSCQRRPNFNLLRPTPGDVENIIKNFPSKTCSLDSIPTWLVKDNLHTLLPILTKVVNSSLTSGTFPDTLKQSIITPVLKKSSLDHNILKHYRPVANIKFISKVIEKAASCQVTNHIDSNDLGENYQSSYKRFHTTETALLKVKSDFLQYVDNNKTVLLVLLRLD